MRIGELAAVTGLTTKTIRYYESLGLLPKPSRTVSGYRVFDQGDAERLQFISKAKGLGLSLTDVWDVLTLHDRNQSPCVHVMALLDRKITEIDALLEQLTELRQELGQLRAESEDRLKDVPKEGSICGIIEQGVHLRGELALVWLEARAKTDRLSRN